LKFIDEAIQEIRTLAQLLHPPLLDEAGLAMATALARGRVFAKRSGVCGETSSCPLPWGAFRRNVEDRSIPDYPGKH